MPRRCYIMLLTALVLQPACQTERDKRNEDARLRIWRGEHSVVSRKPWHEKLAPDAMAADPAALTRIITMSAEEAGKRLGSYKHNVATTFSFNQAARRYAQESLITLHQDSSGNLHVAQDTKQNTAEMYLVGDQLYVKLDNGPFRSKPALNQPIDLWREMANRTTADAITLLLPFITLEGPELTSFNERTVYRYAIGLNDEQVAARALEIGDANSDDTRSWRQKLRPTGVRGEIMVDRETGVPLHIQIKSRADVLDRPIQATSLRLHLLSELSEIGKAAAVTPPKTAIPEHHRIVIDRPQRSLLDGLTDR